MPHFFSVNWKKTFFIQPRSSIPLSTSQFLWCIIDKFFTLIFWIQLVIKSLTEGNTILSDIEAVINKINELFLGRKLICKKFRSKFWLLKSVGELSFKTWKEDRNFPQFCSFFDQLHWRIIITNYAHSKQEMIKANTVVNNFYHQGIFISFKITFFILFLTFV